MLKTKSGLPKFCGWNIDRHGRRRVRFRRPGFSTYLDGIPWSPDFMCEYAKALQGTTQGVGSERTKPGSVAALCMAYYRSPEFLGLKEASAAARRNIIESFRRDHGDKPVKLLRLAHIERILETKAATPAAANGLLKTLRQLLNHAVRMDMIDFNPAISARRFKTHGDGIHTWSEDEIARFEAHHPVGSRERLALMLLLYTAQRMSDVVRMGRQHMMLDGTISVQQQKTGTALFIPVHPELRAVLDALPKTDLQFLTTLRGRAFSAEVFGKWFKIACRRARLSHCSAHGLRKAAATRLADAGCSASMIAAVT